MFIMIKSDLSFILQCRSYQFFFGVGGEGGRGMGLGDTHIKKKDQRPSIKYAYRERGLYIDRSTYVYILSLLKTLSSS